jgi:hypothetical protein
VLNPDWKAWSQQTVPSTIFWSEFDSWLHVPGAPTHTLNSQQVIFLFPALTQSVANKEILQPVLQYGAGGPFTGGGNYWTFYYFYIDINGNAFNSTPSGALPVGDYVETEMSAEDCNTSGVCSWNLYYNLNGTGWDWWGVVGDVELDTIWTGVAESYRLTNCNQYPSGPFTTDHFVLNYSSTSVPNYKYPYPLTSLAPTPGIYDGSPECTAYGASYSSGIQTITY